MFRDNKLTLKQLHSHAIFGAYFAPQISETTFVGTHATVNEPEIDYIFSLVRTYHEGKVIVPVKVNVKNSSLRLCYYFHAKKS